MLLSWVRGRLSIRVPKSYGGGSDLPPPSHPAPSARPRAALFSSDRDRLGFLKEGRREGIGSAHEPGSGRAVCSPGPDPARPGPTRSHLHGAFRPQVGPQDVLQPPRRADVDRQRRLRSGHLGLRVEGLHGGHCRVRSGAGGHVQHRRLGVQRARRLPGLLEKSACTARPPARLPPPRLAGGLGRRRSLARGSYVAGVLTLGRGVRLKGLAAELRRSGNPETEPLEVGRGHAMSASSLRLLLGLGLG